MTCKAILLSTALVVLPLAAAAQQLSFAEVPFAADDAAKRQVLASSSVTVDGREYPIGYHVLARTGDKLGEGVFGALVDRSGKVVTSEDGSEHLSVDADFTSLVHKGDKLYSITHFESRPGAMYISEVQQDAEGNLKYVSTKPIDFSAIGGLWVPCAGSVTPWGAHLGGEEYPPNAREIGDAAALADIDDYFFPMARYYGLDPAKMTLDEFRGAFRPYDFGFPVEIAIDDAGNATPAKHYSMGRVAIELAKVMPDEKTVYISDDGTNVGLFKYIADTAGDLSAGTLYAARWNQTSNEGAGAADVEWIELGHATDAEIKAIVDKNPSFNDIFETADIAEDGGCAEGFSPSNAEGRAECLKVRPGREKAAAFLETRRYASMTGATTEFRKMEGIAFNADQRVGYLAMSEVNKGMLDGDKNDKGGANHIRLAENHCGAVYEMQMDEAFNVTRLKALVAGIPVGEAQMGAAASPNCDPAHSMCGAAAEANTCDINGIANPDNLTYITGYNTLIIGEDTGDGHQNDAIWAYDLGDGKLTRIFSTPFGSETTSPYWYGDLNGHGYLMAVVQHPYGESDEDKLADAADARAYVGYIGPFPAMAK